MEYQIAHSITEFTETNWDAIAGDEITMTHRWQRVMQDVRFDYQPRYLLLKDSQGPLSGVIFNAADEFGYTGWRENLLRRITLGIRPPFSLGHCGIGVRPHVTLEQVLPHLNKALKELCWREKRLLVTLNNISDNRLGACQAHHFSATKLSPTAELDLPATYDQYLETLSNKQRSELRRMRRRAASLDASFEHGPLTPNSSDLYALLQNVYEHHGMCDDSMPFKPILFETLKREMFDDIIIFKALVAGELAGVFVCLKNVQKLWWWGVGLQYEIARPSYTFFLMLDELIRWSIEQGLEHIHGGITSEREKQKQGFYLRDRWLCCQAIPSLLNHMLEFALPALQRLQKRQGDL